jgi:hypothetical protein
VFHQRDDIRDGTYLKTIERSFTYGGQVYLITLNPARIKRNGKTTEQYPGEREQLVEEVIRRIAVMRNRLDYISKEESGVGVTFSIYEVRKELARTGHAFSHNEVLEALLILHQSSVEIKRIESTNTGETTERIVSGSAFPQLRLANRGSEETATTVQFNWLVSEALKHLDFRQIDYDVVMSMRGPIERWLYKRLTHDTLYHGFDAAEHTITASEIIEGCGLTMRSRPRDTLRRVTAAVQALQELGVVKAFEIHEVRVGRRKEDIEYRMVASESFVSRILAAVQKGAANKRLFREVTGDEPMKFVSSDPAKRAKMRKIRNLQKEGELIPLSLRP